MPEYASLKSTGEFKFLKKSINLKIRFILNSVCQKKDGKIN